MRDTTYTARTIKDYLALNIFERAILKVESCNLNIISEENKKIYDIIKKSAIEGHLCIIDKSIKEEDVNSLLKVIDIMVGKVIVKELFKEYGLQIPFAPNMNDIQKQEDNHYIAFYDHQYHNIVCAYKVNVEECI